jgi:uncharacterized cupredoxin-like copper-binding protein
MRENRRMPSPRNVLLLGATLALTAGIAACSAPAPTPTSAEPTVAVDADHVIKLELTADLKIKQDGQQVSMIPVTQGETYTFEVTNTAGFDHDFFIGSDADLSAGAEGLSGIEAWNGGMRDFQYTFDGSGPLAFGCTIPGHYALMKGTFDIQP